MIQCQESSIFIGEEAWIEFDQLIESASGLKIFILADENTAEHCVQRLQSVYGVISENLLVVEAGETSKNVEIVYQLWSELLESGADRNSTLLNIGGGVITDLGGFVASTFKRGITFINIPTSLMAMADAAIGGKTGIDLGPVKNQVGTFAWPDSVLVLPEFLESLPSDELRSGYVECLKHALLTDEKLLNKLMAISPSELSAELLEEIVRVKIDVVNEDPNENGKRKSLNLGHTVGHGIEGLLLEQGNPISHGNAVLLGLIAELKMAEQQFGLDSSVVKNIQEFAAVNYSELRSLNLDESRIYDLMKFDKKNNQGEIRFALLKSVGDCAIDIALSEEDVLFGLKELSSWLSR